MYRQTCTNENAPKFWKWIKERGGVAVWASLNLADPGKSWSTPARQEDGNPFQNPSWEAKETPVMVITDPNEVGVSLDREVRRFRVGVRAGRQGLSLKVTDGGSRKIKAAVEKAGEGAYYVFDYYNQEAVILAPEKTCSLTEWYKTHTPEELT